MYVTVLYRNTCLQMYLRPARAVRRSVRPAPLLRLIAG